MGTMVYPPPLKEPPPSPVSSLLYDIMTGSKGGTIPFAEYKLFKTKNGVYVKKKFWKNFQKIGVFIIKQKYYEKNHKINGIRTYRNG
jgi:hypothetical protein